MESTEDYYALTCIVILILMVTKLAITTYYLAFISDVINAYRHRDYVMSFNVKLSKYSEIYQGFQIIGNQNRGKETVFDNELTLYGTLFSFYIL